MIVNTTISATRHDRHEHRAAQHLVGHEVEVLRPRKVADERLDVVDAPAESATAQQRDRAPRPPPAIALT
jgi:hypothetical protein